MKYQYFKAIIALAVVLSTSSMTSFAQGTLADYERAKEMRTLGREMYGIPSTMTWSEDGTSVTYEVTLSKGKTLRYIVDAIQKEKHTIVLDSVAAALSQALSKTISLSSIDTRGLKLRNAQEIEFTFEGGLWLWNTATHSLKNVGAVREGANRGGLGGYWGRKWDDSQGEPVPSPNGEQEAFIRNSNVYVRQLAGEKNEKQLTFDGAPGEYYSAMLQWSPDGKKLAVSKVRKAEVRQLTLLESSPIDQFQPKLQTRDYVKPGDALSQYFPTIILVESAEVFAVDPTKVFNQFSLSRSQWTKDSKEVTFEYNQRGHQQYAVLGLSAETGKTRTIIQESSSTFIDYSGKKYRYDIEGAGEIIWTSERDGWNHLYLFDAASGDLKQQITKGDWVVRKVTHVDTVARKIVFEASGMHKGEDPCLIRYYTVGFDGKNLKELTGEMANHQASFNDDYTYFVDTYSLINTEPKTVLREAKSGKVIMELEKGDWSAMTAAGWKPAEIFSSVARDGKTDIWGIIVRPRNFDANKTYPVIEYIYAGPHSSFVPKSFYANPSGMQELADLGFVVVQIDGMGTSNRSKAFHDVAWKNLKDAGFPDRILWMKAAAAKYPYMDVERVGIYGTSAGGQSSTAGLLFHPEFYKVGVSSCGCHDNRMDKIWWNEQWMGWPIGNQYAESSNIDNAYRLEGKLMLIVGELDDNVDPSSTYQLVNQLIKHDKDHEFILVPGMGHSSGGEFGEKKRRDYFVKHLLGVDPPKWSEY